MKQIKRAREDDDKKDAISYRVTREGLPFKITFEQDLKEMRALAKRISVGRVFWVEETANTKTMKWEKA